MRRPFTRMPAARVWRRVSSMRGIFTSCFTTSSTRCEPDSMIESGSQRVLDVVKHEVKIPRMLETLRQTRAAGIRVKGLLMMAHPTEGEDSLAATVDFLRTAPLDLAQVTKFTPYPGTPSYPTVHQHGTFDEDWERMNAMNWVFVPHGLTADVLERWFRRA